MYFIHLKNQVPNNLYLQIFHKIQNIKKQQTIPANKWYFITIKQRKGVQDKSQKKMITDFCNMTGASQAQAERFLKRKNWNVQQAINLFLDEGTIPEKKQVKRNKQIDQLFASLSKPDQKTKIPQIDQQNFSTFIQKYFAYSDDNLAVAHILINIMKVQKSGHITIDHFYNLFNYLGCDTPKNLPKYAKKLQSEIKQQHNFKSMYMGTYGFYTVGKETVLGYETGVQIWSLFLKGRMPHFQLFMEYCENCVKKPKHVRKDVWKLVYEFATTVKNIDDVKENDGWPVFLDEFVEYVRAKK